MVETLDAVAMSARAAGQSYGAFVAARWEQDRRAAMPKRTADDRRLRRQGGRKQAKSFDEIEAFRLWKAGTNDTKIARTVGTSRATIQKWRDGLELPNLVLWPRVDTSGFSLTIEPLSGRFQAVFPVGLSPADFARR